MDDAGGDNLGAHDLCQPNFGAATFVQFLNKGIVDDFSGFIDKYIQRSVRDTVVITVPSNGGEISASRIEPRALPTNPSDNESRPK